MAYFPRFTIERLADVRYEGQGYELLVPLARIASDDDHGTSTSTSPEHIGAAFEEGYQRRYGRSIPADIEVVTWRVIATAEQEVPGEMHPLAESAASPSVTFPEPRTMRCVYHPARRTYLDTPVFSVDALPADVELKGPVLLEQPESTLVVEEGGSVRRDRWGNCHVQIR